MFTSEAWQRWRDDAGLPFRNPLKCRRCRRLRGNYIFAPERFIFRHLSSCRNFYSIIHQVNFLFYESMSINSLID